MTPREKLAEHLRREHNISCESEDITFLKGYWTHMHQDCLDRWTCIGFKDGKRVEITGINTITNCARFGVSLSVNGPNSELYGDFVATPNEIKI